MRRSGGASALLAKVNAQLRGERVPITKTTQDDDDGVGAYLSSLGSKSKAKAEVDWSKLAEMSDPSEGENEAEKPVAETGASKFLKKKKPVPTEDSPVKKPKISGSLPSKTKGIGKAGGASTSAALSKVAAFTSKYGKPAKKFELSDSDLDMDLSMDEDVLADVKKFKKPNVSQPVQEAPRSTYKKPASPDISDDSDFVGMKSGAKFLKSKSGKYGTISSDDDDSFGIGKGGNKFLKKKAKKEPEKVPSPEPEKPTISGSGKKRQSQFRLASSEKYSTKVTLDTDEESMAEYMQGLSPSSSADLSARTPRSKSPPSARRKAFMKAKLSPKQVPAASPEPMADIREEDRSDTASSVEEDFRCHCSDIHGIVNIMGLDELEPAVPIAEPTADSTNKKEKSKISKEKVDDKKSKAKVKDKKPPKKEEKPDLFSNLGLFTVDDLLGNVDDLGGNISDVSDIGEQIGTEPIETDYEINTSRSAQPLRSILSPSPKPPGTPKSSRSRVRLSLGDLEEIRSRSPSPDIVSTARPISSRQYSDDFDEISESAGSVQTEGPVSEIDTIATESRSPSPIRIEKLDDIDNTLADVSTDQLSSTYPSSRRSSSYSERVRSRSEDYSEDFTSDAETVTRTSRRTSERSASQDSYTEDYTSYSESVTSRSRTPSPDRRKKKGKSIEVQTDAEPGLLYHWNLDGRAPYATLGPSYGLGYVDPSPIATHAISADALEALTSYSPSVLALNDMLRQQLQLTSQFIDSQKRMHQSYVRNLEPDYMYTTLEDTKNYIKKHRKPKLTFEEALKQVKEEMGMENS